MEIGVQFYTIRDFCKTLDEFSESLKRVADIGYKNVQISGTCAYEAQWLKQELDKNDLHCVLTHTASDKLTGNLKSVITDHDILDCQYVGLGSFPFREENMNQGYRDYLRMYKPVTKALREHGKYFMHHNHFQEYQKYNGIRILDLIAEEFSADELGFTLDTYWVQKAGADPAQWLEKLSGRVPCIHLKDCSFNGDMAVVGEGNINFDRIFEKAAAAGTKYMLVEQDECYGEDPFLCLKRSYQNLKTMGF